MAKAATADEAAAPAAEAPKGKKGKLIIIIVAVVALLAIVGGGAVFFLAHNAADEDPTLADEEHDSKEAASHKADPAHPPVFVNLEPFTVNLQPETNIEQYLQVIAALRVAGPEDEVSVKAYMPEIRHRILLLLSGKRASELNSPEGREQLATQMRDEINTVIGEPPPRDPKKRTHWEPTGPIESVLFTSFIVQ